MSESPQSTLHFPPFHISSDVDLLYSGNAVVPLEPHAVQVLRYLVENHDRVVTKEELLEKIWPDVFTTDGVLKKAVSQARRALGDDPENPRFIRTFHARGYRFIATVTKSSPEAAAETTTPSSTVPVSTEEGAITQSNDPDFNQLVGRKVELTALRLQYRCSLEGKGEPVLIMGEPGIGKTQLARHFQTWAQEQGAVTAYARFFDYVGSRLAPYEVFLNMLRTTLGLSTERQRRGEEMRDLREVAHRRCGVLLPEELFQAAEATTAASQVRATAEDNYRAVVPISECFVSLSRQKPVVIVIDDLQWADEASRDVIGYLMRTAHNEQLMMVLLVRSEETIDPDSPITEWLKRQANYRSYTSLWLKQLDESACSRAIEAVLGGSSRAPQIGQADLRTLHRVTSGNPYFLIEMLRLLIAEGAINYNREAGRWEWRGIEDLRLPETIVMAARAKLDRLSESVREIVESAAVLGDEFRVEVLSRMVERGEEEVERLLREGVRRGVLTERGVSAGEDCRFYHTILRRVVYEEMMPRRRKRLHARAAAAIEGVYGEEGDRVAEGLSAHYEAAGEQERTFEWSMRAWQAARSRWNWSEAVVCIERARRAANEQERLEKKELPPAVRLKLLLGIGEGYRSVGRSRESETILTEAVELAESLGESASLAAALFQQGQTRISLSKYHEANASIEHALEIYFELEDLEGKTLALLHLSTVQVAIGNYEAAAQLVELALEGVNPESSIAANAFGILGWARMLQGYYGEGVPLLERAVDYYDRVGDVRYRAMLMRRLHWAHLSRGDYETALDLAMRARDDFRWVGDASNEAKMGMAIGQIRLSQGLHSESIEIFTRALETFRKNGDFHAEAETLWLLGRAHCEAERGEQAKALLERSLDMVRSIGDRDDEFRILTDIARLKIAVEEPENGLKTADEAVMVARDLRNLDGLGAALVEQARAYLKLKEPEKALESAELAVKLLEETGSGDLWRGYWVLAIALDLLKNRDGALPVLRQCIELLDEMREQIEESDEKRRAGLIRAHSHIIRELQAMLLRFGLEHEAESVAKRWRI